MEPGTGLQVSVWLALLVVCSALCTPAGTALPDTDQCHSPVAQSASIGRFSLARRRTLPHRPRVLRLVLSCAALPPAHALWLTYVRSYERGYQCNTQTASCWHVGLDAMQMLRGRDDDEANGLMVCHCYPDRPPHTLA